MVLFQHEYNYHVDGDDKEVINILELLIQRPDLSLCDDDLCRYNYQRYGFKLQSQVTLVKSL